jgi:hypothetical protein
LEGIQNYAAHQILTPEEFFTGNWEFLHHPLQTPKKTEKLALDGTEAIAQTIINYFNQPALLPS